MRIWICGQLYTCLSLSQEDADNGQDKQESNSVTSQKTLLNEFDIIVKQMNVIGENKKIDEYAPMTFPFDVYVTYLREDIAATPLSRDEALRNAQHKAGGQIKLPKVVQ